MRMYRLMAGFAMLATVAGSAIADPVSDLHALFDSAWERDLEESPLLATSLGDPRYNDR
jgi:hypothetical protein